jgi:hypothetical protein
MLFEIQAAAIEKGSRDYHFMPQSPSRSGRSHGLVLLRQLSSNSAYSWTLPSISCETFGICSIGTMFSSKVFVRCDLDANSIDCLAGTPQSPLDDAGLDRPLSVVLSIICWTLIRIVENVICSPG